MSDAGNALRLALRVADELEARNLPHAIGGALAFGVWGEPRGTKDVDINVFVEGDRLDDVLAAVRAAGADVDDAAARRQANDRGLIVAHWPDGFRLDVFTPSIDFSWEALRTRVKVAAGAHSGWFLSAEAIAVFKLLFFRGKDRVDLARLVELAPSLDHAYVRRQLVEMLGEDDERVRFWDETVATQRLPDEG
ncbi:MAG: hypothetical protein K8M05_41500 [Deltaproteobacteria bacterium]|nr:hypothetical protein [Kofleriaceae bacterium]